MVTQPIEQMSFSAECDLILTFDRNNLVRQNEHDNIPHIYRFLYIFKILMISFPTFIHCFSSVVFIQMA